MPKKNNPEKLFTQEFEPSFEGLQELADILLEHEESDAKVSLSRAEIEAYIESAFNTTYTKLNTQKKWKKQNGGYLLTEAGKKKNHLKGSLDPDFSIESEEELEKFRKRVGKIVSQLRKIFFKGAVSAKEKQKRPVFEKFETTLESAIGDVCKDIAAKITWITNGKSLENAEAKTPEMQSVDGIMELVNGMVRSVSSEPEKIFEKAVNSLNALCEKYDIPTLKQFLEDVFNKPEKHVDIYQSLQDPETLEKYQNWYAQVVAILKLRDEMECKLDKMKEVQPISYDTVRALVFNVLMETNSDVLLGHMQERDPEFAWRPEDLHVPQYLLGTVQRAMDKTNANKIAAGEKAMKAWLERNKGKLHEKFTPRIARRMRA